MKILGKEVGKSEIKLTTSTGLLAIQADSPARTLQGLGACNVIKEQRRTPCCHVASCTIRHTMSKHLGLGGIVYWQLQGDVKIQRSQRKQ